MTPTPSLYRPMALQHITCPCAAVMETACVTNEAEEDGFDPRSSMSALVRHQKRRLHPEIHASDNGHAS